LGSKIAATYLAKSIKDVVEKHEYLTLCDLGNVVHGFARIVSYASILVSKAR
jgi:hypothetical protein